MEYVVNKSSLRGEVRVPASKSHTIRACVLATLAEGRSVIRSPLESDDTEACLRSCRAFGAEIERGDGVWTVGGTGGEIRPPADIVDVANSGTTLYMLLSVAALLKEGEARFDGDEQTRKRPAGPLLDSLNELGAKAASVHANGCAPFVVGGRLRGGTTRIDCPTSQYMSSLLMASPLADGSSEIEATLLNEKPYVEMTLGWLRSLGAEVEAREDLMRFRIEGGQNYRRFERDVPADFSSATFLLVAGALFGERLALMGLDMNDTQGDKAVVDYLRAMGAGVDVEGDALVVSSAELQGRELDLNSTPDALPAMAVAGCFARGETRLVNVPQARLKETDRICVMREELFKMGADVEELEDGLVVRESRLHGARLDGRGDHRVVMALSVAALGADGETRIGTAERVGVTFPGFARLMRSCGADLREVEGGPTC